jgi:hypothetical protein
MVVMVIEYLGVGIPPSTCCSYPVLPHGDTGLLRGGDCGGNVVVVNGVTSILNGDQSCPCTVPGPVPIEQSTWGALKALYD